MKDLVTAPLGMTVPRTGTNIVPSSWASPRCVMADRRRIAVALRLPLHEAAALPDALHSQGAKRVSRSKALPVTWGRKKKIEAPDAPLKTNMDAG